MPGCPSEYRRAREKPVPMMKGKGIFIWTHTVSVFTEWCPRLPSQTRGYEKATHHHFWLQNTRFVWSIHYKVIFQINCTHLKIQRVHLKSGFLASLKILEFLTTAGERCHVATADWPEHWLPFLDKAQCSACLGPSPLCRADSRYPPGRWNRRSQSQRGCTCGYLCA